MLGIDEVTNEQRRGKVVVDEAIDAEEMDECVILDEEFVKSRELKDKDDKSDKSNDYAEEDTIDMMGPLSPFATEDDIIAYEKEKHRHVVYEKYNMFYVPNYEDSPQDVPYVASLREESEVIPIFKRAMSRDTFAYNSWLTRNKDNNSVENSHIVEENDDLAPTAMITPKRLSRVPPRRSQSHRRISPSKRFEHVWIEGVDIKSKVSPFLDENYNSQEAVPKRSDPRIFTFKAITQSNE